MPKNRLDVCASQDPDDFYFRDEDKDHSGIVLDHEKQGMFRSRGYLICRGRERSVYGRISCHTKEHNRWEVYDCLRVPP